MDTRINIPAATGLNIDQYLGPWAIEPGTFDRLAGTVQRLNWDSHLAHATDEDHAAVPVTVAAVGESQEQAKIGIVSIRGVMTKRGSSLSDAGSTIRARREIRLLADNDEIDGILLVIDSPGGTVAGTADLGAAVRQADLSKPVFAFVEDMAASAAFWVASQARQVFANTRNAKVGSIGVVLAAYDLSRKAEDEGVEAVVIKTGFMKGAGFPGAEITQEQRDRLQEMVSEDFDEFLEVVARARGISIQRVSELATGEVFSATKAIENDLIDGVQSLDATLSQLQTAAQSRIQRRREMSAASYAEIVEACAGIEPSQAEDSQFLCDQLQKEATAGAASRAWAETLKARAESAREEAATATATAQAAKREQPGVQPLEDDAGGSHDGGSAREEFFSRVEAKCDKGIDRGKALKAVVRADPELHRAMVAEVNAGRKAA